MGEEGQEAEDSRWKTVKKKMRGRGGGCEKGGRAGQETSAETSVGDGPHSCASV